MSHPRRVNTHSGTAARAALFAILLLLFTLRPAEAAGQEPAGSATLNTVQFSFAEYIVGEYNSHIDITVTLSGPAGGDVWVDYNTFDDPPQPGSASQKSDYEIARGRLRFVPGETSKTFRVLLVTDLLGEGEEGFGIALSGPVGASVSLGSPSVARVRVLDTGPVPGSFDADASVFVRQNYLDFLNREPDTAGGLFWFDQIRSCNGDPGCLELRKINVSAAFFLSIEFQRTGVAAYLGHKAAFGTRPDYVRFEHDVQELQRNFVFGQPGATEQLEANKNQYFYDLGGEINLRYSTTMSPAQLVDVLYTNAGITPTAEDRQAAIAEFTFSTTNTADANARGRLMRRIAENPAFARAEFNRAFVLMQYFGYLRRDPDDVGYNFWLAKLNQFNGDFVHAEMVKAFLTSDEYRHRFEP